jgi:hypothetical protein
MFLDELTPERALVSHGYLGTKGDMGYPIIPSLNGINFNRSLSAHASSILKYKLSKKYNSFHTYIGLNDSSSFDARVVFQVLCDSKIVYESSKIKVYDKIIPIEISLENCEYLELRCINKGSSFAHSVWINPQINEEKLKVFTGPFNNSKAHLDFEKRKSNIAVVLFATENVSQYLYTFIKSFKTNSKLEDYEIYITCPDNSSTVKNISKHFDCVFVKLEPTVNYQVKSLVDLKDATYLLAKHIDCNFVIISDIDIIINGDLNPSLIENKIGICRDYNTEKFSFGQLIEAEWSAYNGNEKSKELLKISQDEFENKSIINCGYVTADKKTLSILDSELRKMLPFSQFYLLENNGSFCREQALINLGLIRSNNFEILNDTFNHQLLHADPNDSTVIHLNGKESKQKYKYLIDEWLDDEFGDLKKSLIEKEIKNRNKVLNWTNEHINHSIKLDFNDFVSAKKLINEDLDLAFIDLRRDVANLKIVMHLIEKYLEKGKVIGLCSNQEYKNLQTIQCNYEIIGEHGHLLLVHIKKIK